MITRPPRVLLIASGIVAIVVLVPLVYLVVRAVEGGLTSGTSVLAQPSTWTGAATSLALAAAVAGTTIAVGVPLAWILVRAAIPMRRTLIVLVVLPLAVPSFVGAFAWVSFFPGFSGFWAAWLVLTVATLPYVVLPSAAALRTVDPAHEEVARTLGLRPIPAFLRACLPQIWPAVGGGALLVALYVLSDFGAVSILRLDTLSRMIYASYRSSFDRSSAAVLALLLACLAILVVVVEQRARGRAKKVQLATAAPRAAEPTPTGRWTGAVAAIVGLPILLGLCVPVVSTVDQLLSGTSAQLDIADLAGAAATTAWFGVVGMVTAIVLAIPVGLLVGRYPSRISRNLEQLSFVGHALPGVVVGLSVVFVGTRLFTSLYQTVALLGFAYGILFLPKAAAAIRGSVAAVPPILEDVARTLGASPLSAFTRVTLRLASPGVAAGAVLVMLTVMKELPATLMLRPTGTNTLATRLWSFTDVGALAAAAPYALALIAIGAVPAFALAIPMVRGSMTPSTDTEIQAGETLDVRVG